MDERTIQAPAGQEMPIRGDAVGGPPRGLDDPRALQILSTEHWSLLSARSLVYNEAFARAGMFLTFLSATLVALGLISNGMRLGSAEFLLVAAVVLGVDLFVGVATMGRVATATNEDVRYLQGMNRIRHAYHEIVPGLEPYFIAGKYDDIRGVFVVYGEAEEIGGPAGILHGFTTVIGMIGVICSAVAATLVGVVLLLVGASGLVAGVGAVLGFAVGLAANVRAISRALTSFATSMDPRFPTPTASADPRAEGRPAGRP
jgi:Na+-transporting methylmalonyl-CoA/oxaloacetate decarboxylase gamma subunit